MKIFSFMRKPLKPILYGALLALLCTVALIFTLQYRTDKQTLESWLHNYTYVGTICPDEERMAMLSPIPEEAFQIIEEAETICATHTMQTYAAKLLDGHMVVDNMMTMDQLQQRYFVHARIKSYMDWNSPWETYKFDRYSIEIVDEWGSQKIGNRGLFLNMTRLADEPAFHVGDEVFFTSGYLLNQGFVIVVEFDIYTPAAWEMLTGMEPLNLFMENPFLVLEEGEGEEEILAFLDETGMLPYYEKFAQIDNNLAVRAISDFYALPRTANDRVYVTDGRAITKEDAGKKVCMIHQNLMNRNRYGIGDTITLSVAEDSYSLYGWENGNPMPEDELITSYGEQETYEIIGFYNEIGRDPYDPLYYSYTDIFIPAEEESDEMPLPYAFSFKVAGVDYDAFVAETMPMLEATGCVVTLADTGWRDVEDAYYAMEVRCKLMFGCAVLSFIAAVVAFTVLLYLHLRKEYGLQRLMGAYRREACQVYLAAMIAVALPALAVSGVVSYLIVKNLLQSVMVESLLLFAMVPTMIFVAVLALLLLLIAISERGSLRNIII